MVSKKLVKSLGFSILALTLVGSNPNSAHAITKRQLEQQLNSLNAQFNNFVNYVGTQFTQSSSQVGPQGPKGDKGDRGDTGPQGPAGQNFVPVTDTFSMESGCVTKDMSVCLDANGCNIVVVAYPKTVIPGFTKDQVIRREFNVSAEQQGLSMGGDAGISGVTSGELKLVSRQCASGPYAGNQQRFTQDTFNWVIQSTVRQTLFDVVHHYHNPNLVCSVGTSGLPILSKTILSVVNYNPQGCNTAYNADSNPYTNADWTFKLADPLFRLVVTISD